MFIEARPVRFIEAETVMFIEVEPVSIDGKSYGI